MLERTDDKAVAQRIIAAWGDYVVEHLKQGWSTYLLTFMFEPLHGSQAQRMDQMRGALEKAYGIFATRVVRKVPTAAARGVAPIWLCSPDLPVFKKEKRDKARLHDLIINDGLHYHAILLMPPWSRMSDVKDHFYRLRQTYSRVAHLNRVDVEAITHENRYVVRYVQKQSEKGNFSVGDNFALPRSISELPVHKTQQARTPLQAGQRRRQAVLSAVRR